MNFFGLGCNKSLSSSLKNKSSSSKLSVISFASSSICGGMPKLAAFSADESSIESISKFDKSRGLSLLGFKSLKSLSNIEPTLVVALLKSCNSVSLSFSFCVISVFPLSFKSSFVTSPAA